MTVRLEVLGLEVLTLKFEIPQPTDVSPVDRGIKRVSTWWVNRMSR